MLIAILTVFIAIASNGLAACIDYASKQSTSSQYKVLIRLSTWLLVLSWIVILDYNVLISYAVTITIALLYALFLLIKQVYDLILNDNIAVRSSLIVDISCIPVLVITLLTAIYNQYITKSLQTQVDTTLIILISFISLIVITITITVHICKFQTLLKK